MTKITIGARGSKLSLTYVAKVKELLLKNNNDLKEENINFKAIKTSGDLNLNKNISEIGGKNLFCKEIEESLLKKEIDIAVHSLKDMEANENESLLIGAYLKRNDYRDVIISEKIKNISKSYNSNSILDGITFSQEKGEIMERVWARCCGAFGCESPPPRAPEHAGKQPTRKLAENWLAPGDRLLSRSAVSRACLTLELQ